MSIYQNFTFKDSGASLTGDADFINAATGTAFEKTSGDVFTKISTNIFNKAVRKIISQTEMDTRYVNATGDATLSGHMVPSSNSTLNLGSSSNRFAALYSANVDTNQLTVNSAIVPSVGGINIGGSSNVFSNVYASNFVGNASSASTIYSTEGDANVNYYIGFFNGSGTGNKSVYHDNEIYVNPSTNTIVCSNFAGNASSASTLYSTETDGNGSYFLGFVASSGSGNQNFYHDNEITINPATNTITCTNFAGNATSSTYSDYTYVTRDDSTNAWYYVNFSGIGSSQQRIRNDGGLAYNPAIDTLSTGVFSGTATAARYADLAEKYESDTNYEVGTVVEVGGDKEITLFQGGALAGVISTKPGLMLNSEAGETYQYVALKGKVPVLTQGEVKKGQYCVAVPGGKVQGVNKYDLLDSEKLDIVGVALSDSENGTVIVKV